MNWKNVSYLFNWIASTKSIHSIQKIIYRHNKFSSKHLCKSNFNNSMTSLSSKSRWPKPCSGPCCNAFSVLSYSLKYSSAFSCRSSLPDMTNMGTLKRNCVMTSGAIEPIDDSTSCRVGNGPFNSNLSAVVVKLSTYVSSRRFIFASLNCGRIELYINIIRSFAKLP